MSTFKALKQLPKKHQFSDKDVMVVFGELFQRGYANGIVDEAKKAGMKVIYSTVGRRDKDGTLRSLNAEELGEKDSPLVNIPLEAGFDLMPSDGGVSPVDQLKPLGLKGWEEAKLDWGQIESSQQKGISDFRKRTQEYVRELEKMIRKDANVVFVHTMAGGFPRAKVVMPIANKVFKGTGPRYLSSKVFWDSDVGRLCDKSFNEVTAETLRHLVELTASIRDSRSQGKQCSYVAYGYHGNEVLIGDKYEWYSYSPYLQGWAKTRLEDIAQEARDKGIATTVYNVPEILTNSSSIFLGVEVVLYPLLRALKKDAGDSPQTKHLIATAAEKLKDSNSLEQVDELTQSYLQDPLVRSWPKFEGWPQHNGPEQMLKMRETSTQLIDMHKDSKDLMTATLSELVFRACGRLMLNTCSISEDSALWIGHNIIAELTAAEDLGF